ncbi:hypothetical protein [Streptomyces californicus]|uniref:hypothetical protein n=1 Tax=Streptomyces californicus TaxID=67351 RepID=UPI003F545463
MVTPAPVVAGDEEDSQHWTTMRPDWHTDPTASPRVEDPAHVFDGELLFGGIHGHDSAETTDESPDRVAGVAELTAAYLHTAFDPADNAWQTARDALTTAKAPSAASGRSNPLAGEQAHQQPTTEKKMSRVAHTQHSLGSGFSAASTADDVIGGIDLTGT